MLSFSADIKKINMDMLLQWFAFLILKILCVEFYFCYCLIFREKKSCNQPLREKKKGCLIKQS